MFICLSKIFCDVNTRIATYLCNLCLILFLTRARHTHAFHTIYFFLFLCKIQNNMETAVICVIYIMKIKGEKKGSIFFFLLLLLLCYYYAALLWQNTCLCAYNFCKTKKRKLFTIWSNWLFFFVLLFFC